MIIFLIEHHWFRFSTIKIPPLRFIAAYKYLVGHVCAGEIPHLTEFKRLTANCAPLNILPTSDYHNEDYEH